MRGWTAIGPAEISGSALAPPKSAVKPRGVIEDGIIQKLKVLCPFAGSLRST